MELSNFYTDNTFQLKYNNIYSSEKQTFMASWDLQYIGNSLPYDTSNLYTLCVDNDMNMYADIKSIQSDINHVSVETEIKQAPKNAISFVASTKGATDISTNTARATTPNCTYKSDMKYSANNYNNINDLDISKSYIFPLIYVINKNDFKENYLTNRTVPIDTNKIQLITLSELYTNKDKYYVTSYKQRLIYTTGANKCFDLGNTTPVRHMYQNDNVFSMAGVANIAQNYSVSQSDNNDHFGFWYSQSNTGVTASPISFLNECKALNAETNNATILPVPVSSFDYTPEFDGTDKYFESVYDVWKVTSFMENGWKRTSGLHVWKTDFILKLIASQGLFVAWSGFYNSDIELKSSGLMALGEMNSAGFTTGKIITPNELSASKSPNLDYGLYTDSIADPNKYIPIKPEGDDITPPKYRITDQIGGFTMYYKCNQADLLTIVQRVNFPDSEHTVPEGWEFAPHLVSCTQYPFNVSQYAGGHASNVIIGSWDSGVSSISLTSTQLAVQTIASFTLDHKYNSFLDYSPYAQYQLYIPLCGWVDLPDNCLGKTITVDLATDVINNSCLATVNADGCPVAHKAGHMGTSVSLSVTENGLKQAALTQSLFNTVGAITSTGYAVATQNPVGIVNGIASVAGAVYQGSIANNSNYTRQIGSTGNKSDFHVSNTCYLKKMYTVPQEPDNYSHTCGYPSDTSDKVNTFSGYNVFTNIDTSGLSCNQKQKEMIKSLLETGVFI